MSIAGADKVALRRQFGARRHARSPAQRRLAARRVTVALAPLLPAVRMLLAYQAFGAELSLAPLLALAQRRGLRPLLPRHRDCPEALACEVEAVRPQSILVLLPGLAFDRHGTRLGHGAGFYDRLLSRLPTHAVRIGVGYACQMTARLPREPHDAPLDAFVSEHGLFFSRAARPAAVRWLRAYCQPSPGEAIVAV